MKAVLLLGSALLTFTAAQAADLGVADLPRIHGEYKANQARWAREFLDKTFAGTMTVGSVSNVFGNDKFMVAFMENPSDWMPGVACEDATASDFLISKNKGDSIFVRGVVKDHSFGSLALRDCEFFDSEKAAADADVKRLADVAEARDQAMRQAAAITSVPDVPPAEPAQTITLSLPGPPQRHVPRDDSWGRQALQSDNRPRLDYPRPHQCHVRPTPSGGLLL